MIAESSCIIVATGCVGKSGPTWDYQFDLQEC